MEERCTAKKGGCLFLAGGLLRSVSRCTLGERFGCLLSVGHCVVLLFLSHRAGQTEALGRVRPASTRNATRKWFGRVESDVLHLQTLQSGDMEPTVHTSAPHAQCTRGKIACDHFHLKEVQDDAEEKRLLEEVSVDSDIVGATTSGRGEQSSQKGGGESSTKECGESSQE